MLRTWKKGTWVLAAAALLSTIALGAAACGDDDDDAADTPTAAASTSNSTVAGTPTQAGIAANIGKEDSANLTGAGATFPAPIYQAWFDDYNKDVAKNVKVNYQAAGSGGGIQQFTCRHRRLRRLRCRHDRCATPGGA
ncbi:MAG: substrate-binding domain-containing protein [Dehalococcoidia bacterium]